MKIWKYICKKFKNKPKNEIEHLIDLINKDDAILDKLKYKYCPPGYCCPWCASPEFIFLYNKNERRKAWLKILLDKKKGNK